MRVVRDVAHSAWKNYAAARDLLVRQRRCGCPTMHAASHRDMGCASSRSADAMRGLFRYSRLFRSRAARPTPHRPQQGCWPSCSPSSCCSRWFRCSSTCRAAQHHRRGECSPVCDDDGQQDRAEARGFNDGHKIVPQIIARVEHWQQRCGHMQSNDCDSQHDYSLRRAYRHAGCRIGGDGCGAKAISSCWWPPRSDCAPATVQMTRAPQPRHARTRRRAGPVWPRRSAL